MTSDHNRISFSEVLLVLAFILILFAAWESCAEAEEPQPVPVVNVNTATETELAYLPGIAVSASRFGVSAAGRSGLSIHPCREKSDPPHRARVRCALDGANDSKRKETTHVLHKRSDSSCLGHRHTVRPHDVHAAGLRSVQALAEKPMNGAEPVTVHCPACRDAVTSQAGAYVYRRVYLCKLHKSLWDAADDREHAKGKRCPHDPAPCVRLTETECRNRRALAATSKGESNVPTQE